jgi:NMD protein affecting ribosome stability and mRNA decay
VGKQRISLINYDVLRELCDSCRKERFHFVPLGAEPATGTCRKCGAESKLADMSDTAVFRLVTQPNGEMVVVPIVRSAVVKSA